MSDGRGGMSDGRGRMQPIFVIEDDDDDDDTDNNREPLGTAEDGRGTDRNLLLPHPPGRQPLSGWRSLFLCPCCCCIH